MLAYILAIAVGLASLSLYLSAFFLPELHRKDDFLWSGVGLFYALVLWVCAGRITGGVLLGQSAAVTLVVCFGWQTLRLRRAITHPDEKTDIRGFSFVNWLQNRFKKPSTPVTPPITETPSEEQVTTETETETPPEETPITSTLEPQEEQEVTADTEIETTDQESEVTPTVETPEATETTAETDIETLEEETPIISTLQPEAESSEPEVTLTDTETPETKKQGFSLKSIFGLGKSQSQPTSEPANDDLEESNWDDEDEEEVTPSVVAEIEAIESETVTPTTEAKQEESTEPDTSQMTESLQEYVAEFEPFMADDEAETLIEDYQPKTESSESETTEKDENQPVKTDSNQKTDQNEEEKKSN